MISGSSVRPSVRRLAEDCRQLVIRQAPGDGARVSLRWGEAGEVAALATLEREGAAVLVDYRWRDGETWRSCRQTIGIVFDVPHFGGTRHFWQCSLCKGGARKLYAGDDGRFACKRCLGLAHQSQRQRTWRRALARSAKIRSYLDPNSAPADPFPPRPKRMRRATYAALKTEAEQLEAAVPVAAWVGVGTANARLGVRRDRAKRRWWPARNEASRAGRRPGHGG